MSGTLTRFLGLCLLLLSSSGFGQTVNDTQLWENFTLTGHFYNSQHEKTPYKYWLEAQQRNGDDISRISQVLLRPGLGYVLNTHFSVWVGAAWIATSYPLTNSPFDENRLWQQLLWNKLDDNLNLMNRLRIEERSVNSRFKTAYRLRNLFKVVIPIYNQSQWYYVLGDELFWSMNDYLGQQGRGFDQNRLFIGLGHNLTKEVLAEIGYMNQTIRRFGVPDFSANILGMNLFINL